MGPLHMHFTNRWVREQIFLVGTVHISKQSSRMVTDVIASVKPDVVMVELCAARRDKVLAMARGHSETVLDSLLRSVGLSKEGASRFVGAGLITSLDSYLRGNEMLAAIQAAESLRAQVLLGDQDATRTVQRLREAAAQISPVELMRLVSESARPSNKTKQTHAPALSRSCVF